MINYHLNQDFILFTTLDTNFLTLLETFSIIVFVYGTTVVLVLLIVFVIVPETKLYESVFKPILPRNAVFNLVGFLPGRFAGILLTIELTVASVNASTTLSWSIFPSKA